MSAPILVPPKHCAVYCRVSSDERLDQSFNSIDAQKESGLAFIKSQTHEGWVPVPDHYDDGGFSGGNMDRPALRRLMADIEAGKVDIVVVYKIDRLSRSLADFARMVETFDRCRVSFSAVTQQINSATSMGRLMLNVLLSFAQFEREVNVSKNPQDKLGAYVLLATSCDKSLATTACFTSIRVVCQNTLHFAIQDVKTANRRSIKINHSQRFDEDQIHQDLGLMEASWECFMKKVTL